MLRKTLVALTAVGALGVSSAAIAAGHGSHGMSGGSHGMSGGSHGMSGGSHGMSATMGSVSRGGPTTMGSVGRAGPAMHTGPSIKTGAPVGTWSGSNWKGSTWKSGNWQGRHHHHHGFRNAAFIGVGFGAGFYGGYDSCWRLVPTYWGGWQRVWVCDP